MHVKFPIDWIVILDSLFYMLKADRIVTLNNVFFRKVKVSNFEVSKKQYPK